MAAKNSHSFLEVVIFVLAAVELALIIPYIILQHRAGAAIEADLPNPWTKENNYQDSKW